MKLIIQIPCYNEANDPTDDTQRPATQASRVLIASKSFIVDDGSSDATVRVAP